MRKKEEREGEERPSAEGKKKKEEKKKNDCAPFLVHDFFGAPWVSAYLKTRFNKSAVHFLFFGDKFFFGRSVRR